MSAILLSPVNQRRFIRLLIGTSAFLGFCVVYEMHLYMPWLEMAFLGHIGLWLSTLGIKGWLRFIVAAIMIPSMVGIFLLWWNFNFLIAILVVAVMTWPLIQLLCGRTFDA